jgi:transposase
MERYQIRLDDKEREKLEILQKNHTTTKRMAERAKIVLLSSDGSDATIATKLDCSARRVCKWKRRYCEGGLSGLDEKPRPGRPCNFKDTAISGLVHHQYHSVDGFDNR